MAWRIDEAVVRGEIDNRVCGWVTGRLWFVGSESPVELKLQGNCWRDLAGRRLEFTNPSPRQADWKGLAANQTGVVGDITAARRVKVPEIPMSEIGEYYLAGKPWPWHWGNALYLEWFSEYNGRVVIESADFVLRVVGDAVWELTPEKEIEQQKANAQAMRGFMDRLVAAIEAARPRTEAVNVESEERNDEHRANGR